MIVVSKFLSTFCVLALLTILSEWWVKCSSHECFVLYFWYGCFLTVMNLSASMCENNRNWCAISFDVKYYLDLDLYEVWFQFSNIWPVLFKVYQPSHLKIIRIRSHRVTSPVFHHVWFVIYRNQHSVFILEKQIVHTFEQHVVEKCDIIWIQHSYNINIVLYLCFAFLFLMVYICSIRSPHRPWTLQVI